MSESKIKVEYVSVEKISPATYNPRTISDAMVARLRNSIDEFGLIDPIIVNKRSMNIIGGHQRYHVAREMGRKEVPVVYVDLPPAKEKALNVLLNKVTGDWEYNMLYTVLRDIDSAGIDIDMTGWEWESLEALSGFDREQWSPEGAYVDEEQKKSEEVLFAKGDTEVIRGGRSQVLKGDIIFPSTLPFNIPALVPEKLAQFPSNKMTTYVNKEQKIPEGNWYHCLCNKMHPFPNKNKTTLVSFATWDEYFEATFNEAEVQAARLLNLRLGALTMPDFSIWARDPLAVKIFMHYKSMWVGRYWQEVGLNIMPFVGVPFEDVWKQHQYLGIPKNAPCVFMQAQTGSNTDAANIIKGTAEMLKILTPKAIIIYGTSPSERPTYQRICEKHLDPSKIVMLDSFMAIRGEQRKLNKKGR